MNQCENIGNVGKNNYLKSDIFHPDLGDKKVLTLESSTKLFLYLPTSNRSWKPFIKRYKIGVHSIE